MATTPSNWDTTPKKCGSYPFITSTATPATDLELDDADVGSFDAIKKGLTWVDRLRYG